jgi:hypothetical protein
MGMRARVVVSAAMVAALFSVLVVSQAAASELIEFEQSAALAANGTIPPVPAKPLEEAK